ncbi:16S rRNA (cytidine(1402)-2'-O)-methyltransferase [Rubellimicrobium sp. CFH 75288]|uniref:16S rRNA (cytidine(1402)-2'-O)-methyltransferase n=1 Tax=Rubellimicrobium sp. CFH 75288 TaxID=2697034 RepID=UPI00141313D4|nr:16S rRNA (cytidine(1402)-2'-O)-methyltransferase [Rubellimicrobium sp. CFH 75288]NAZ36617.1 16S rRNA (cytidine(1402)-2'-O)-methyltransferase [Rubellimicrobium sp. CFH 75288]
MNDDRPPKSAAAAGPSGRAPGELVLVSTPIGAARDITLRALDVLGSADILAAEDTRSARRLLDIHGIALGGRRLVACHDHSGPAVTADLVRAMEQGATVAYLSEAGTPLVSDPGFTLARAALACGLRVTAAPGASALLAALAVSGLPADRFLFAGFLPATRTARRTALAELRNVPATLVFFESPQRVNQTLRDLCDVLGDRQAALCRELTKRFEEVRRGPLSGLAAGVAADPPRGEIVLVVARGEGGSADEAAVREALRTALRTMRLRDAAAAVAGAMGWPRAEVYRLALALKEEDGDGSGASGGTDGEGGAPPG